MVAKKKVATKSKEVVNTGNNGLAVNFAGDVGQGLENADKDSFAIPFLSIIQKMSPCVDEDDAKYDENARPGMLTNTVSGELFDGKKGVWFLPCGFQRRFLKWGPRGSDNGGFKGEVLPEKAAQLLGDGDVVNESGRLFFPKDDGTVDDKKCDFLADTRNHFGLLIHPETGDTAQVLLSLTSTQIKKSKTLMTLLNNVKVDSANGKVTPPTWANRVLLTTVSESNEKGSWSGLKIELDGFVDSQELYDAGKAFHKSVSAEAVIVNYEAGAEAAGESDDKF